MYKHKPIYLAFLITLSMGLSGCKSLDVKNIEKDVNEYNKLVENTINSYSKSVAYSKKQKESILKDLTSDTGIALNEKYKLSRLTDEEKNCFNYYMVNMDEYFTSLGATATREVILLVGSNKKVMNLILVWSGDELLSIERRVVSNA